MNHEHFHSTSDTGGVRPLVSPAQQQNHRTWTLAQMRSVGARRKAAEVKLEERLKLAQKSRTQTAADTNGARRPEPGQPII